MVLRKCLTIQADEREGAQMEDRVEDLLQAGVLDPAKVTRSGLMNACGIAGIMLTTQVCYPTQTLKRGVIVIRTMASLFPATMSKYALGIDLSPVWMM